MAVEKADLLTIDGVKYITLAVISYEGSNYVFTNKITDDEEATDEFYIFKEFYNGLDMVVDDGLRNILLPKFQEILKDEINKLMEFK